jgi:hypothetical protein
MRRWLAFIAGLAAVVLTSAAFGMTGADWSFDDDGKGDRSAEVETTTTSSPQVEREEETPSTSEVKEIDEDWARDEPSEIEEPAKEEDGEDAPPEGEEGEDEVVEDDRIPPDLMILHPVEGQVFERKEVAFEGITEPGARVFAGDYEADVDQEGNWRIVLILSPGGNHATLRAVDRAGNVSEASVSVFYQAPADEPKEEEPPADKPKEEEPPADEPKEEVPGEEEADWYFEAHQVYGECSETPPFDVFYGHGKPGTRITVVSEYGDGATEVNDQGEWEIKVYFEGAPVGKGILVKVKDEFGNYQTFEFTRTA